MLKTKYFVVTSKDGTTSLVKATTAAGALAFKRAQLVMEARLASQDDMLTMRDVKVEDATQ